MLLLRRATVAVAATAAFLLSTTGIASAQTTSGMQGSIISNILIDNIIQLLLESSGMFAFLQPMAAPDVQTNGAQNGSAGWIFASVVGAVILGTLLAVFLRRRQRR